MRRRLCWLLVLLLGTVACATPGVALAPAAGSGGLTYLALGDSYTIGEGVAAADRWPAQLAAQLRAQGVPVAAPTYIARTGWTTAELQTAIADARPAAAYGLVSLLIGVNNQYRGQTVALYRSEFRALLQQAVGFAGGQPGHVVVLSIPDWGQSPQGQRDGRDPDRIGAEIDRFNAVAQAECRQAGVAYVDITPRTRAAAGDACQFARDGLHYSGLHMSGWAGQALPVVRGLLK